MLYATGFFLFSIDKNNIFTHVHGCPWSNEKNYRLLLRKRRIRNRKKKMRGSVERPAKHEEGVNIVNAFIHQNIVRTPITEAFTSNTNVRYLMEQVQAGVLQNTGRLIGPQPIQYIASVMKKYYLTQGPYLVHLPDLEVEKLNRLVLQELIHEATQGVESYDRYLKDSFTQPTPPDRPCNVNTKGSRQFEINRFL